MLLRIVREGLGRTIALLDQSTRMTPMSRPADAQRAVDSAVQAMALYQYFACPFCIKTRRAIHRLNLPIELRDAQHVPEHRSALLTGGGRLQVPCLRIDEDGNTQWLYESSEIIAYLERRFGGGGSAPRDPVEPPPSEVPNAEHAASERRASKQKGKREDSAVPTPKPAESRSLRAGTRCLATVFGLFAGATSQADPQTLRAYECREDGVTTFSDQPCGRVERRVFLGYSSPKTVIDDKRPAPTFPPEDEETNTFIDRLEIKRAIARAEGRISDLQKDRDNEITRLRSRLENSAMIHHGRAASTGPPNRVDPLRFMAVKAVDDNLVAEIQMVNTRYAGDIAIEEQRLDSLRKHLERMDEASGTP